MLERDGSKLCRKVSLQEQDCILLLRSGLQMALQRWSIISEHIRTPDQKIFVIFIDFLFYDLAQGPTNL